MSELPAKIAQAGKHQQFELISGIKTKFLEPSFYNHASICRLEIRRYFNI